MEPPLRRPIDGRLQTRLRFALALGFILVALMPLAAGDLHGSFDASMRVSTSEASPGDNVTFWISVDPHGENVGNVQVTETLPAGLAIVTSLAPSSCVAISAVWHCSVHDTHAFTIEIVVVVQPGTEGQHLVNVAQVEGWSDEEDHQSVTVSAEIHVVPATPEQPDLQVRVNASQTTVVPGTVLNYRIELTNAGTAPASNVTVIVTMPAALVLVSASPWPIASEGLLNWTIDSIPVTSREFLFNTTLPSSNGLNEVQVGVAVTYGDGQGNHVRVEGPLSSLAVVPTASGSSPLTGILVVVLAIVGGGLVVAQRTVGIPLLGRAGAEEIFLLHRSGLVLKHFSVHPSPEADSDIVGGMMSAVRMFVEDSVSPSAGPLREIRFGGGNIVFVNGRNVTLAAVNAKGNRAQFADRAKRFLRQFERMNGNALMNFDGMAGGLMGVDALVRRFGRPVKTHEAPTGLVAGDVPRQ